MSRTSSPPTASRRTDRDTTISTRGQASSAPRNPGLLEHARRASVSHPSFDDRRDLRAGSRGAMTRRTDDDRRARPALAVSRRIRQTDEAEEAAVGALCAGRAGRASGRRRPAGIGRAEIRPSPSAMFIDGRSVPRRARGRPVLALDAGRPRPRRPIGRPICRQRRPLIAADRSTLPSLATIERLPSGRLRRRGDEQATRSRCTTRASRSPPARSSTPRGIAASRSRSSSEGASDPRLGRRRAGHEGRGSPQARRFRPRWPTVRAARACDPAHAAARVRGGSPLGRLNAASRRRRRARRGRPAPGSHRSSRRRPSPGVADIRPLHWTPCKT